VRCFGFLEPVVTPVLRPASVGTWARPIAVPLDRCAELLGVDLATVQELATTVEPYIRVDGTKAGALCSLSASSGPRRTASAEAATSTADEPRPSMHEPSRAPAGRASLLILTNDSSPRPSRSSWWGHAERDPERLLWAAGRVP
jgi:hypothetical protein